MTPTAPPAGALHRSPLSTRPAAVGGGDTEATHGQATQGTPSLGRTSAKQGGILNWDC
jgi:hypothetical protein